MFAEARIGAAGAFSGAVEARLDAAEEDVSINARRLRMRIDHLLNLTRADKRVKRWRAPARGSGLQPRIDPA